VPNPKDKLDAILAAVDERIERMSGNAPADNKDAELVLAKPALLTCPVCAGVMHPGIVSVHGTLIGFMVVGMSHEHCWFEPKGDIEEHIVIPSGCAKDGWRCLRCGFVGIGAGESRPSRRGIGDV
jgi:hypothetical protein